MRPASVLKYFSLGLLVLAAACATPTPPEGGPRDETPPRIDTLASTPNFQTNFRKQPIELTFNEWVVLEDVFNQVVISPPLAERPEITIKRRTVKVTFPEAEVLRDSATYTINFGEAVKDLTEKNPAENLRFVFSTGPFLDSLELRGQLIDAFTNEPVKEAAFMLYDQLADSVVRTQRPFYFAKSDENGRFQIKNIRAGTFKGFALEETISNYKYDQPAERIAFPGSPITVSADSNPELLLRVFAETPVLKRTGTFTEQYGLVKLAFNRPPHDLRLQLPEPDSLFLLEREGDTLRVWHTLRTDSSWNILLVQDTLYRDTVAVPANPPVRPDTLGPAGIPGGYIAQNPARPLQLTFNHPLRTIDTNGVGLFLLSDTLQTRLVPVPRPPDSLAPRTLTFDFPWQEDQRYQLVLLPGALTDIFGIANDTLRIAIKVGARKDFGNILLAIEQLDSNQHYLLELLNRSQVVETLRISGRPSWSASLLSIKPATYTLRITEDLNDNGRWDTGAYPDRLQPERVFYRELPQLRPNWDLDVQIDFRELLLQTLSNR